jgi:hypothetical protein
MKNSFDVIVGVDRTFRNANIDEDSEFFEAAILNQALTSLEQEQAKFNWRIGANYNKSLNENNYLKFGVRPSSVGYQSLDRSDLRFGSQHDGEGGFDPDLDPDALNDLSFSTDYLFMELPVSFGLIKIINKFSIYGEADLSPNIFLTSRIKQNTDGESSTRLLGNPSVRRLHLSGILAAGVAYQANDNFSIFVQPSFRYHLTNLAKVGFVKEHLYSYGIEFGLKKLMKQK